jgi:hypothetical protein
MWKTLLRVLIQHRNIQKMTCGDGHRIFLSNHEDMKYVLSEKEKKRDGEVSQYPEGRDTFFKIFW